MITGIVHERRATADGAEYSNGVDLGTHAFKACTFAAEPLELASCPANAGFVIATFAVRRATGGYNGDTFDHESVGSLTAQKSLRHRGFLAVAVGFEPT